MANIFEFSYSNPVRFYHQSDITLNTSSGSILLNSFNPSYNFKTWDKDFFVRVLKAWQDTETYKAKFQQCDPIIFQWSGSDATSANYVVRLLNCDGTTYAVQIHSQITGTFDGNKVYECKINTALIAEGTYHIQVQHIQTGADVFCISEPIEIKSLHTYSCQLRYFNSYNKDNIKFNNDIEFIARVDGHISEFTPEASFYVYEDQPKNLEMLSGKVARQFLFTLVNLPEYKLDQINRMTLMDSLYIDGVAYTRVEGAKFEQRGTDHNPLKTYSIQLRERYNNDSTEVEQTETIQIAVLPETSRFYVKRITIAGSIVTMETDFAGANNFVDYLNNLVLTKVVNLSGFFAIADDGYLHYRKATGETISGTYSLDSTDVLPYGLDLGILARSGATTLEFDINTVTANRYAVIWGDGTQQNLTPLTGTVTPSKTYSSQKYYNARVYVGDHDDSINFTASDDIIVSVKGDISPNSLGVVISGKGLKEIGSSLVSFATGVYTLDFSSNNLSTIAVNFFLKKLSSGTLVSGATVDVSLQSPSAPPADTNGMKQIITGILNQGVTLSTD